MGSGSSSQEKNSSAIKFKHGKPLFKGTNIYPMFNNSLYRISDCKANRWAFYNDTADLIIHIAILFDYDSSITPLGETTAFRIDDPKDGNEDDYGKYLCEVDVAPGATQLFVEGIVTGWRVDTLEARAEDDERQFRL